jgi:hypothetical protein
LRWICGVGNREMIFYLFQSSILIPSNWQTSFIQSHKKTNKHLVEGETPDDFQKNTWKLPFLEPYIDCLIDKNPRTNLLMDRQYCFPLHFILR